MREPNSWSLPRRTLPNTEEEASSGAAAALAPIPTKSAYSFVARSVMLDHPPTETRKAAYALGPSKRFTPASSAPS